MSKEHMNYLRRKTADEAELWAADRIEQLERKLEMAEAIIAGDGALITGLKSDIDATQADNARLREAIRDFLMEWDNCRSSGEWPVRRFAAIREALAATPAQSLAHLRNGVLEEAAKVCDDHILYTTEDAANVIRAMKEPE